MATMVDTAIRRTSRPLSLPSLHPSSPFILSSESPSEVINRWSRESDHSPISSPTVSSLDHTPQVYTARIASRATADLVRLLDLAAPNEKVEMEKKIGRPAREPSTYVYEQHGQAAGMGGLVPFENPRTPPLPPSIPLPNSPASPLTRENMAKFKNVNKLAPAAEIDSSKSTPPSRTPKRADSKLETTNVLAPAIEIHPPRRAAPARTIMTETSIFSLHTDDFEMPTGDGPARSDVYDWPLHTAQSRAAMERDTASISRFVFPSPPDRPKQSETGRDGRVVDESFMNLDGGGTTSTTYRFPPSAPPTISRQSIATDASSAYAPSMAAPSSIVRRTAAWAQGGAKTETVAEEVSIIFSSAILH